MLREKSHVHKKANAVWNPTKGQKAIQTPQTVDHINTDQESSL